MHKGSIIQGRRGFQIMLLLFGVLASLACGPLARRTAEVPTAQPFEDQEITATPTLTATPTPTPTGGDVLPTVRPDKEPTVEPTLPPTPADETEPEVPEGTELFACPGPGSTMLLKFSANISIEYGSAQIQHALEDGVLGLIVEQGEGSTVSVVGVNSPPIPYRMSGSMDECSFEG